jgi:SRSO17 transposase
MTVAVVALAPIGLVVKCVVEWVRDPAKTDLSYLSRHHQGAMDMRAAHQQMKEELGLDHFEGRSWQGIHRHALMTMIAYAFLQHRRLAATARKKKRRVAASANFARRTSGAACDPALARNVRRRLVQGAVPV